MDGRHLLGRAVTRLCSPGASSRSASSSSSMSCFCGLYSRGASFSGDADTPSLDANLVILRVRRTRFVRRAADLMPFSLRRMRRSVLRWR